MARIPYTSALAEVQQSFRDVWAQLAPLGEATPFDWRQRRLINLADGVDATDAVTQQQLTAVRALIDGIADAASPIAGALTTGSGRVRRGAFSARGGAAAHAGEWFLASDQNNVLWYSTGTVWVYVAGQMRGTLSPNEKPTGLGTDDVGYLFLSTDFDRAYRWDGSAWADAPGEPTRGMVAYFMSGLVPAVGWALCDGSSVTRSTPTGGTTSLSLDNLTTDNRFIRSVSGASGGTGGSATTHTHAVDPPSTTTSAPSAVVQAAPVGTGVATDVHTHTVDIASFTSGAPSGTGGADALPPYVNFRPYLRL